MRFFIACRTVDLRSHPHVERSSCRVNHGSSLRHDYASKSLPPGHKKSAKTYQWANTRLLLPHQPGYQSLHFNAPSAQKFAPDSSYFINKVRKASSND